MESQKRTITWSDGCLLVGLGDAPQQAADNVIPSGGDCHKPHMCEHLSEQHLKERARFQAPKLECPLPEQLWKARHAELSRGLI